MPKMPSGRGRGRRKSSGRRRKKPRLNLQVAKVLDAIEREVSSLPAGGEEVLSMRDRELLSHIREKMSGSLVSASVTAADLTNAKKIARRLGLKA